MGSLWPLVLRSLRSRPLRAILTAAAVALGVAVVLAVQITLSALDTQARAEAAIRAGTSGLDVRSPSEDGLNQAQVAALAALPGVARAEPLREKRVTARVTVDSAGVEATLVSVSPNSTSGLRPINLTSGRLPHAGARDEVAVDAALADGLVATTSAPPLTVGGHIMLTSATGPDLFRVVGITSGTSGGAAFSRSAVFVSDATLLSNFSDGLRTTLVALQLAPGTTSAETATGVRAALGGAATVDDPRSDIAQPLDQLRPMLILITILSLIVGGGVTANSVSLSVLERRREIGLLRAAGAGASQVYRVFIAEGVLSATAGALLGIALGVILGGALVAGGAAVVAPDIARPPLEVNALMVLGVAALAMVAAFVGGSIPAVGAARMPPLAAIRPAPNAGRENPSRALMFISPLLLVLSIPLLVSSRGGVVAAGAVTVLTGICAALPMLAPMVLTGASIVIAPIARQSRLAAANLGRRRNRTALTTAGLVVSVATAVAVSALTAGALAASDHWIGRLLVGNAVIHSGVAQPAAIEQSFTGLRGVQDVSPVRYFTEIVGGEATSLAAVDPAFYARRDGLDFVDSDRSLALRLMSNGPNVLIPRQLAAATGLRPGDTITAGTAEAGVRLAIVGVVDHSFPAADGREAMLIAQPVAVTYFGEGAAGFNDLLVVADDHQLPSLESTASRFGVQATPVATIQDSAQSSLRHVIGLLFGLSTIAVAIAMLAIVNTLLVNVRQSARELGLLRAVGMARSRAVGLLLTEAALLAGTGAIIGVGTGCLLALPMLQVSGSSGFYPEFRFPIATAGLTVAAVMFAAILAALIPSRRAAGASIVSTIRYE